MTSRARDGSTNKVRPRGASYRPKSEVRDGPGGIYSGPGHEVLTQVPVAKANFPDPFCGLLLPVFPVSTRQRTSRKRLTYGGIPSSRRERTCLPSTYLPKYLVSDLKASRCRAISVRFLKTVRSVMMSIYLPSR